MVLEHGHRHPLGTTVGDCVSPDSPALPVLAYRHRGPVDCILKTDAKIQGKDTLDLLVGAPDGPTSLLLKFLMSCFTKLTPWACYYTS